MWFLPNSQPSDAVTRSETGEYHHNAPLSTLTKQTGPRYRAPEPVETHESQAFYVALIILVAISLRLLVFVLGPYGDSSLALYPDSHRYAELGQTLVEQGAFGLASDETGVVHVPLYTLRQEIGQLEPVMANGLRPEIMRTPGYPALLGIMSTLGLGINGLLILQCVISAVSVGLVYGIGRALLKRPVPALLAAGLVAIHPAAVAAPTAVLTETCFTLLILLGIWSVADREARGLGSASFGGMMIGLSVLVRPVSIFLGPAIALWMITTDPRRKTLGLAGVMLVLSLAPGLTWMTRNNAIGFGYRLSSIPYINTYFYGNAYMRITEQGGDWKQDWPATVNTLMGELRSELNTKSEADAFDTMKELGVQAIKDDPGLYTKVYLNSMAKFFTDHSMGAMYQQLGLTYTPTGLRDKLMAGGFSWENLSATLKNPSGLLAVGWTAFNGFLLLGMALGAFMLFVRGRWATLLLLGGVMFYFAFATQTTGLERFRIPVLGIQALLVASLFLPWRTRVKQNKPPKRRWYERDESGEGGIPSDNTHSPDQASGDESASEHYARPI